MTQASSADALWAAIFGALTFVMWFPHLVLATRLWRQERSARSFRNFFIALLLQAGLVRIVTGSATRTWPDLDWLQALNTMMAALVTLFLLSGAVLAWATWRRFPWSSIRDIRLSDDARR